MEVRGYLKELICIQQTILNFLESQENQDGDYKYIFNFFEEKKIKEDRYKLKITLHLLSKIIKNYNHHQHFFDKIENLLLFFKDKIKQSYSNFEIFKIFKNNKRILLFLIHQKLLVIDDQIYQFLKQSTKIYWYAKYLDYFYQELKPFNENTPKIEIENFEEKRKTGENDSYICYLIRNDMIKEFIIYINKNNINLNSRIPNSIFETNIFLIRNDHSLIEYAAFFGSLQIFQYLRLNSVGLNPCLWQFAIHGKNAEIIHFLEEDHIIPYHESYNECYKEAIKCHHNDIAKYIYDNFNVQNNNNDDDLYSDFACLGFRYYNFEFIQDDIDYQTMFYYACNYDYYDLVKLLLDLQKVELNGIYVFKEPKQPENPTFPLNFAAKNNNQDIINFLLSQKEIQIRPFCFYFCEKLTEIKLPETLTELGNFSFKHCSSLIEITIPISVKNIGIGSFSFCKNLKRITILSPINKIDECMFNECSSLEIINIPSTVVRIEKNAFAECKNLKEIKFPTSLKFIGSYAFWGCSSLTNAFLPSNIIKICSYSFRDCISITEMIIPLSVKVINDDIFYACESLIKVVIPTSVTMIGQYSFAYCSSLKQIVIPSSIIKICEGAFKGCSSLEKIEIPSSVTEIECDCFEYCKSLMKIKIPSSVNKIKDSLFSDCSSLNEILFESPSSVSSFGKEAFKGCSSLTHILIPSSAISIKQYCFCDCTSLEQISFEGNSNINSIKEGAFKNCKSLKKISIPETAISVAQNAFEECLSLKPNQYIDNTFLYFSKNE